MNKNKNQVNTSFILLLVVSCLLSFHASFLKDKNLLEELQSSFTNEDFVGFEKVITDPGFGEQFDHYDCVTKGKITHLIGNFYYSNNDEKKAIQYFKETVFTHWSNCNGVVPRDKANTLYNIGVSYHYTDQIEEGKQYLDSTFLLIEKIANFPKDELALKFQGAGSYFADIPDYLRAETYFKNAISLANNVSELDAYYIHIDLMALYLKFYKYRQAENIGKVIKDQYMGNANSLTDLDRAIYYLNSAEGALKRKEYDEAIENCNIAIQLLPKEDVNYLSNAHEILGAVYYEQKDYNASKVHFEQTYQLRLAEQNVVSAGMAKAYALENIAELEKQSGNYEKALSKINEAIALIGAGLKYDINQNPILNINVVNNAPHLIRQLNIKERIVIGPSNRNSSVPILQTCLDLHMKIDTLTKLAINTAAFDQSTLLLLENLPDHTPHAIEVCNLLYHATKEAEYIHSAFQFSSNSKSSGLKKIIESNRRVVQDGSNAESKKYQELANKISEIQSALLDKSQNTDSLQRAFVSSQLAFDQLVNKSKGKTKQQDFEKTMNDLNSRLTANTAVVDISAGLDSVHIFFVTKNNLDIRSYDKLTLTNLLQNIRNTIIRPTIPFDTKGAQTIYNLVFKEWLSAHTSITKLIFIEDGIFQNFPMETLVDEQGKYLVESYDISYAYMIDMLLRDTKSTNPTYPFAGFATNYTDALSNKLSAFTDDSSSIGKLITANLELDQCKAIYKEKYFYNENANVKNFKQYAFYSDVVYLSLHGLVDSIDGANSSIVFDDRDEQLLLRSFELYQQPMNADLVILSACNSADGKVQKSEGIVGLSRAFVGSGVSSLVSSLWPVSENSSMQILPLFLKKYKEGNRKTKALSEAKMAYLQEAPPSQKHPYYWANFILISGLEGEKTGSSLWWILGLVSFIGLIVGYWWIKGNR